MKNLLLTCLLLAISNINLSAQCDTLPPLEKLYESIQVYYQSVKNAELLEYQESQKGEWLKYVPNLGVTYTVAGQPRPSVNLSTSVIYTARKDKQIREAKKASIISTTELLIQQEQRKLSQLYGNYQQELRSLKLAEEIQEIEEQIFMIQETKFKNLELTPLQYLPIKRNYLQKQYDLAEKRKAIDLLICDMLFFSKWNQSK